MSTSNYSFSRQNNELQEFTIEGQLVTLKDADSSQQQEVLSILIDDEPFECRRVVLDLDEFGNQKIDSKGETKYRYTTIHDAVDQFYVKKTTDQNPIPVLCHQQHLKPTAMCRVCMVLVQGPAYDRKTGQIKKDEQGNIVYDERRTRMVPSCHRTLDNHIRIITPRSNNEKHRTRLQRLSRTTVELLMSDHSNPQRHVRAKSEAEAKDRDDPELYQLARNMGVPNRPRFPKASPFASRAEDHTSGLIQVDHKACILCDRCIRSCTDVKKNLVIGRTGSGYQTRISFDLDQPMGDSDCVECGECAISCPTDALQIDSTKIPQIGSDEDGEEISVEEILSLPLLNNISSKYLKLVRKAFRKRTFKRGDIIITEGEIGNTAYLIEEGKFQVSAISNQRKLVKQPSKLFSLMSKFTISSEAARPEPGGGHQTYNSIYGGTYQSLPEQEKVPMPEGHEFIGILDKESHIFGEASCLNQYPHAFTVQALSDHCTVIEIRRNIVLMLLRDRVSRELLEKLYRERSLSVDLKKIEYFSDLAANERELKRLIRYLKDKVELVKVRPGQTIARQGTLTGHLDFIRIGFVGVQIEAPSGETYVERYLGPGKKFGDLAILSSIPAVLDTLSPEERKEIEQEGAGRYSATYLSMDHVEMLRIRREDFLYIYENFPATARMMRDMYRKNLQENNDLIKNNPQTPVAEFLDQGLANARSLLVIDLLKCTRCEECTKACSDAHGGVTRLIREGLRYDKYLVTSSCRSCRDPYCMMGCPVDAIHRGPTMNMQITDWCIGCGLCADNCPYGNINMHSVEQSKPKRSQANVIVNQEGKGVKNQMATICDLCEGAASTPSCVYACPHDAAHRMSGEDLFHLIGANNS